MSDDPTLTDPVKRLRYFDKQFLQAGDFTDEQTYHMRMRRLLNRSFLTPGVGFGLELELSGTDLTVKPGLAIDDQGREIVVNEVLKPQAQPSTSADVYLQYQETESDPARLGVQQPTRWDQTPQLLTQTAGDPAPPGAVCLGRLKVDGGRSVDVGSRQLAGLRSPGDLALSGDLELPTGSQLGIRALGTIGNGGDYETSLRAVGAKEFFGDNGLDLGTAVLGLGFEYKGSTSSKHGFVGSGRRLDWTVASLTQGRWLRIGANQGRIAFYTDGTVAKDGDPKAYLEGADLHVQGEVFSSSLTVTGDLRLGATPRSLLTGGKLDASFLPDTVPQLTSGKLDTGVLPDSVPLLTGGKLTVDSLEVTKDFAYLRADGTNLYAMSETKLFGGGGQAIDPVTGQADCLGLAVWSHDLKDNVAFLGMGRNWDLTIASLEKTWLRIGASGKICFWMNGNAGLNESPQAYLDENGNFYLSGSVTSNNQQSPSNDSDRRLKKDIGMIPRPLNMLRCLTGVRYRWNDVGLDRLTRFADGLLFESGLSEEELAAKRREARERARAELSGDCIGMIAQDVREVVPEVVEEGRDGYLRIAYDRLVALLVEAVKEQQEAIEKLEGELGSVRDALALRNA